MMSILLFLSVFQLVSLYQQMQLIVTGKTQYFQEYAYLEASFMV